MRGTGLALARNPWLRTFRGRAFAEASHRMQEATTDGVAAKFRSRGTSGLLTEIQAHDTLSGRTHALD